MKLTLSWLKDHLDTSASAAEIAEALTRVGLEVESVTDPAAALSAFTIAYVVEAKPHPNADRLRVCMVETGMGEPVQVVCGAPNARTGMKSVFSPVGTYIPGKKITLGKGVIRGVESLGMLCSAAELELSEDHDGIIELPADAPVGSAYAAYAGLDDAVIEINVTPNRADALGIRGIARDLAAAGVGTLKSERIRPVPGTFACPVPIVLEFAKADAHLCPAFALRLVRGVKNGPSPDWMQKHLRAIGLRPINALVDITNYMTYGHNRPLHVFDAGKVKGGLTIRRAGTDESLLALDGRAYALDNSMVVIADENGVESIGGIMGGEASGCDENTTDVLIESALWDPLNIARTGRALGIHSDARYRFERGVDPEFCRDGLELATHMVLDLCGGTPSDIAFAGAVPDTGRAIDFPWTEVKRLTGLDLPRVEMKLILEQLGFTVAGSAERVKVAPPSWRADIEGKADLVEEITRIAGLDRVSARPLPRIENTVGKPMLTTAQKRVRTAKRLLAARGMTEAVTWSFIAKPLAEHFGGGRPELALANPIAADLSDMRPSNLPGLIKAAQANADRGYPDVALFEVGQVFRSDTPDGQIMAASGIRRGTAGHAGAGRDWADPAMPVNVFAAKADAMALLTALGVPTGGLQVVPGGPAWFHPGRSGTLQLGPKNPIGFFGEIHPRTLAILDAKGPLVGFEIELDALPPPKLKLTKVKPKLSLSEFQPVSRDFAFVVDKATRAGDVQKAVIGADRNLIESVSIFDLYEGEALGEGRKSIAVAVTLQPRDKTMTDVEIEAISTKIIAEVAKKTGATLRG